MSQSLVQQAVILAAGLGTRLMPLTADRPKALVEIAGVPLLRRLLDSCQQAGLTRALVVSGHRRTQLEDWLADYDGDLAIQSVHNPHFDTRGNAWSLRVAKEALGGRSFIKFDGDLLLDASIISALRTSSHASAIVIDSAVALDAEAMKAQLGPDGSVMRMGKWLPLEQAHGESIGVEKIAGADAGPLFDAIERAVEQGRADAYYEDVYHQLVAQGWSLGACDSAGQWWCEVDDCVDLERAQTHLERL